MDDNERDFSSVVDISVYNVDMDTWNLVDMLKTPRAYCIMAAVDDNAIIVIGGCHKAQNFTTCKASAIRQLKLVKQCLRISQHTRLLFTHILTPVASELCGVISLSDI